jgi:hypothetical protein
MSILNLGIFRLEYLQEDGHCILSWMHEQPKLDLNGAAVPTHARSPMLAKHPYQPRRGHSLVLLPGRRHGP